jgi:hypothetical protein
MSDSDDFSQLDDPAFLAARSRVREELEHAPHSTASAGLTARYEAMNAEFLRRARIAWEGTVSDATSAIATLPAKAARMVAVEILLADPESLGDDVLESCLYILREKLRVTED